MPHLAILFMYTDEMMLLLEGGIRREALKNDQVQLYADSGVVDCACCEDALAAALSRRNVST